MVFFEFFYFFSVLIFGFVFRVYDEKWISKGVSILNKFFMITHDEI